MGTVKELADEVGRGLAGVLPWLRKTVAGKLSLAVGAMTGARRRTRRSWPAYYRPWEAGRKGMREQWLRRLLKNPLQPATAVMEPFAREELAKAARNG